MIKILMLIKIMGILLFFATACSDNSGINLDSNETDNQDPNFPGSYSVKNENDQIIIPFEMFAGNKPMIKGKINGKGTKLLIDNGKLWNEVWFYNGETDSIGLSYKTLDADSVEGIGKNDPNLIYDGNPINIDFENITFNEQPTLISPPESGYADFFPGINGQICGTLFKHFIVTFDFVNLEIQLTKPEAFEQAEKQTAIKMQKRENGSYCIPFEIETKDKQKYNTLLDIDIGTVFPLYLILNQSQVLNISPNAEKQFLGLGASGEIYGYIDTLDNLIFGDYILEKYPTLIVKAESNSNTSIVENGTFGVELMKQFTVSFDYINEIIYFEPNVHFNGIDRTDNLDTTICN